MFLMQADIVADPVSYRAAALHAAFGDVAAPVGVFHGIALPPRDDFRRWLSSLGLTVTQAVLRHSPLGQVEPHWIHTDAEMGDWMAILYLTLDPPNDDGTIFWERAGWRYGDQGVSSESGEGYTPWLTIKARCNSAIVFPAAAYHSRALKQNYGTGDHARLIEIAWGTGSMGEDLWQ